MAVETTNTMICKGKRYCSGSGSECIRPSVRASITCPLSLLSAESAPKPHVRLWGRDDPFHHKHDATGPSLVRTLQNSLWRSSQNSYSTHSGE